MYPTARSAGRGCGAVPRWCGDRIRDQLAGRMAGAGLASDWSPAVPHHARRDGPPAVGRVWTGYSWATPRKLQKV